MQVKILKSKHIYKGRIFELRKDTLLFGNNIITREIIKHPGSSLMIPVFNIKKREIIMINQYRYAAKGNIIEFPAGTKDKNETYAKCASRELIEEIGYKASKIIEITKFYLAPGTMTEIMSMFLCFGLTAVKQDLEKDEKITPFKITLKKAIEMIFTGKIKDAKTIAALLTLKNIYSDKKLFFRYFKTH